MELLQILMVILLSRTMAVAVEGGDSNMTKTVSVIKELPDSANATLLYTNHIKPTKCITQKTSKNDSRNQQMPFENKEPLIFTKKDKSQIMNNQLKNDEYKDFSIIEEENLDELNVEWTERVITRRIISNSFKGDTSFYDIDYFDMDFKETDKFEQDSDFGDYDELIGHVEFNEFGSNLKSEVYTDQEDFEYYEYFDGMINLMSGVGKQNTTAASPNGINKMPDFNYDEEYEDFGTLFADEELTDYEDYCESLRYFQLLDSFRRKTNSTRNKDSSICFDLLKISSK